MKILLPLLFLLSVNSFSATVGTLNLIGTIPKKVEITVTPKTSASNIDLEITESDLSVGTITGKSNSNGGYKISIVSANLGLLKNGTSSPTLLTEVGYTMKVDSQVINLSLGSSFDSVGKAPFTKDITVSHTGVDSFLYEEGNFTDVVTFTISAN